MRRKRYLLGCVLCLILLNTTSCATWKRIENPKMNGPEAHYSITVPECWIHAAFIKDRICISKDGPLLNWIEIAQLSREQGFPMTGVKLGKAHLVTEVAEYYLAELKELNKGGMVKHLGTEPAELGGQAGFKIRLEIIEAKGLTYDVLAYGMMDDRYFYALSYRAPRLHYFQKELAAFEGLVASFKTRK